MWHVRTSIGVAFTLLVADTAFSQPTTPSFIQITHTTGEVGHTAAALRISPDGSRVVFVERVFPFETGYTLFSARTDGGRIQLTPDDLRVEPFSELGFPVMGGGLVAFLGRPVGTSAAGLYVVPADGTGGVRQLNTGFSSHYGIAISADGSTVAFVGQPFSGSPLRRVVVARADGTAQTVVFEASAFFIEIGRIALNPDGSKVVLTYGNRDFSRIATVNSDGTGFSDIVLTSSAGAVAREFVWSADGNTIAFCEPGVYVMNPDGTNLRTVEASGQRTPAGGGHRL